MPSPRKPATYKPFSVMEGASGARLWPVMGAVLFGAFVMLCLGSKALLEWANNLPISSDSDYALYIAQKWQDWMDALKVTFFADAIHDTLTALQSLHW